MPLFIYALTEPDSEDVRYIGASKNPQERLRMHLNLSNRHHKESLSAKWIQSLKAAGKKPGMFILEIACQDTWQEAERRWIAYYLERGANLTNISPGGYAVSEATRQKMQVPRAATGKPRKPYPGFKPSADTIAKRVAGQKKWFAQLSESEVQAWREKIGERVKVTRYKDKYKEK